MTDMIEVARNSVQTWECDQMGHMNVQFYMEKAAMGLAAFAHHIGLGPAFIRAQGARLIADEHHVRFLREQRPGAPFFLRAGATDVADDRLGIYQEMVGTVSGEVAATFAAHVTLQDEEMRVARPLPEDAIKAAERFRIALPAHGSPRGLELYEPGPAPNLADADARGMLPTFQGQVQMPWCDAQGFLTTRHFMGLVSDAIPNLLAQTRGEDRSSTPTVGGAALEYRFVYRKAPKAGDLMVLRSGLKSIADKTYTWCHWMFDLATGEALATAEAVAIALDLKTRKAIAIPDDMRAGLEKLVIPGLGV